ncbi:Mur ligase family protein [Parasutterella excrementihominis]
MSVSQKVLVLGLGASGRTAARFYASRGFEVLAADTRPQPPRLDELQKEIPNLKFLGGAVSPVIVAEVSEVMISPGLSPEYSVFAPAVKEAKHRGIAVVGEIELFARELKKLKAETGYAPKIIGITGTNGKTTTTMLSTAIIAEAGKSVVAAGNVGPNALGELEKHRQVGTLPDFWVLELSSFQLETTESLHCDSAALLNITEDHIDWHGSMEKYAAAKRKIFSADTVRVLNREDPGSMLSAEGVPSDLVHTFGSDAPKKIGDFGISDVGAVVAALAGFGPKKVVLILGGDGKGQDFAPLKAPIETHAKGAVFIGRDAPLIEKEVDYPGLLKAHAKTMAEAVREARAMAKPGDTILLSPACASWDMFKDYADRSAQFVAAAKEIAEEEGQLC